MDGDELGVVDSSYVRAIQVEYDPVLLHDPKRFCGVVITAGWETESSIVGRGYLVICVAGRFDNLIDSLAPRIDQGIGGSRQGMALSVHTEVLAHEVPRVCSKNILATRLSSSESLCFCAE